MAIGSEVLGETQARLAATAENIANLRTPGYKSSMHFNDIEQFSSANGASLPVSSMPVRSMLGGPLQETGNPLDLALVGNGAFLVQSGGEYFLTRSGRFQRDEHGRVVTMSGHVLQQAGGGDLVIGAGSLKVLADGTVLEDSIPVARIGLFGLEQDAGAQSASGVMFSVNGASSEVGQGVTIAQGMIEGSNVQLAGEMLTMMEAVRRAEIGSRIVQAYDTLLGQAVTTFGRGRS